MSDEKSKTAETRQVVLIDNHNHRGAPAPKGTILDNVSPLTAQRFPKIFATFGTAEATKAIAAKEDAERKAKEAADDAETAAADAAKAAAAPKIDMTDKSAPASLKA